MKALLLLALLALALLASGCSEERAESRPTFYGAITSIDLVGDFEQHKITVEYLDGTRGEWLSDTATNEDWVKEMRERVRAGKPWVLIEPVEPSDPEEKPGWTLEAAEPMGPKIDTIHLRDWDFEPLSLFDVTPYDESDVYRKGVAASLTAQEPIPRAQGVGD